jgi:hypothetical protein
MKSKFFEITMHKNNGFILFLANCFKKGQMATLGAILSQWQQPSNSKHFPADQITKINVEINLLKIYFQNV